MMMASRSGPRTDPGRMIAGAYGYARSGRGGSVGRWLIAAAILSILTVVVTLAIKVLKNKNNGNTKCWLHHCEPQWPRHRHKVQAAKGHAGHKNQTKSSSRCRL